MLNSCFEILQKNFGSKSLPHVLLFINKQEPSSPTITLSCYQAAKKLKIKKFMQKFKFLCHIQEINAHMGDGIYEGFNWINTNHKRVDLSEMPNKFHYYDDLSLGIVFHDSWSEQRFLWIGWMKNKDSVIASLPKIVVSRISNFL